ncbi:MAG TPA: GNAT family N-acetyltransferase [Rectinemataceae bacterium]|nr:GNAT family N-acetyltransferase [Rectinemataceae bacterium]
MEIVDLSDEYVGTFCKCLEDWSAEMREAGDHKEAWLRRHRDKGLRVKLARDEGGRIVGLIQYMRAEEAPVIGRNFHYIYCIWVHGYKEGVGDHRKKGIGKALLLAAEEDARSLGSKGLAAWGLRIPVFMRSAWFKRQGYRVVDRDGMIELVYKAFAQDAAVPKLLKVKKSPPAGECRVRVTCLLNGWCPAQALVYERARKVASEFPDAAEFVGVDTDDRKTLEEWGMADALFIDDRQLRTGPPPSVEAIRKQLVARMKKRGIATGVGRSSRVGSASD